MGGERDRGFGEMEGSTKREDGAKVGEPHIETEPEIESWRQRERHRDSRTETGTRVNTGERWEEMEHSAHLRPNHR